MYSLKMSSNESDHSFNSWLLIHRYLARLWVAYKADCRVQESMLRKIEWKDKWGVWERKETSVFLPVHIILNIMSFYYCPSSLSSEILFLKEVSFLNFLSTYKWYLKAVPTHFSKITFLELSIILIKRWAL